MAVATGHTRGHTAYALIVSNIAQIACCDVMTDSEQVYSAYSFKFRVHKHCVAARMDLGLLGTWGFLQMCGSQSRAELVGTGGGGVQAGGWALKFILKI